MSRLSIGLGCLGLMIGAFLGMILGSAAGYALASPFTDSRESQAYLGILIVPAVGCLGALTGGLTLAAIPARRGPLLAAAGVGWVLLAGVLALAISWHQRLKPVRVRVRNATPLAFHNVWLGSDFRRSTRIGDLGPGETSDAVTVDLGRPDTLNALEGRAGNGYVRHRLPREKEAGLVDGNYMWVVGGVENALSYELVRDP